MCGPSHGVLTPPQYSTCTTAPSLYPLPNLYIIFAAVAAVAVNKYVRGLDLLTMYCPPCRHGTPQGIPTRQKQETNPGSQKCMATPMPALLLMSGTRWTSTPCCTQATSFPVSLFAPSAYWCFARLPCSWLACSSAAGGGAWGSHMKLCRTFCQPCLDIRCFLQLAENAL